MLSISMLPLGHVWFLASTPIRAPGEENDMFGCLGYIRFLASMELKAPLGPRDGQIDSFWRARLMRAMRAQCMHCCESQELMGCLISTQALSSHLPRPLTPHSCALSHYPFGVSNGKGTGTPPTHIIADNNPIQERWVVVPRLFQQGPHGGFLELPPFCTMSRAPANALAPPHTPALPPVLDLVILGSTMAGLQISPATTMAAQEGVFLH